MPLLDPHTWDRPTLANANPVVRAAIRDMVLSVLGAILVSLVASIFTNDWSKLWLVTFATSLFALVSWVSMQFPVPERELTKRSTRVIALVVLTFFIASQIYESPDWLPHLLPIGVAIYFSNRAISTFYEQEILRRTSTLCSHCGYDLRKSSDPRDGILPRCPECGRGDPTPP